MLPPANVQLPVYTPFTQPTLTSNQKRIINYEYDYLDPNRVNWDTYQIRTDLGWKEKLFIKLVRLLYQDKTRGQGRNTWTGQKVLNWANEPHCMLEEIGKLSHSEYAVVTVSELGLWKGLRAYHERLDSFDFQNNRDKLLLHKTRPSDWTKPYFVPAVV